MTEPSMSPIPAVLFSAEYHLASLGEIVREHKARPSGEAEVLALAGAVGALRYRAGALATDLARAEQAYANLAAREQQQLEAQADAEQLDRWREQARELARATIQGRDVPAALLLDVLGGTGELPLPNLLETGEGR